MYLYLKEAITRCGNDDLLFFQTAYMFIFNKQHDCVADVCQYRLYAVVPTYVCSYVKHLQEHEK